MTSVITDPTKLGEALHAARERILVAEAKEPMDAEAVSWARVRLKDLLWTNRLTIIEALTKGRTSD